MNVLECLFRQYGRDKIALSSGDTTVTYNNLCYNVVSFSKLLVEASDVVVIYMANSIEYVIAYFAVLMAGKKALLINPMYPEAEVCKYLKMVNGDVIISNVASLQNRDGYRLLCPTIIDDKVEENHLQFEIPDRRDEGAIIIPTSGTTGEAKLIMLTHENIMTNVNDIVEVYSEISPEDVEMIILPMTSIFCNTTQLLVPLYAGMTVDIWTGGFNIPAIIKEMEKKNVTYCQMVPAILRLFALVYARTGRKLSAFKRTTVGGEPISREELMKVGEAIAPIKILQGYGMTETSPVISSQLYHQPKISYGTTGKIMKSVELKIVPIDDDSQEGIIYVKGPSVCNQTYDGKTLLDKEGWLNTGDVGYLDEEGELVVCGREKNIIVVGGMNVYPEEVEGVIKSFPGVLDVLVYGERNDIKGECVKAKVVVKESVDIQKLKEHCTERLALYKVPTIIEEVDELVKTYSSKVKRYGN